MSGAAFDPAQHQHQLAAAARGRCGVTHPRGSGDLRQRRHGLRLRLLPRVALWANQRSWEGFGHSGAPRLQQLPNQSRDSKIVIAPPVIPAPSSTAFLGRKHEHAPLPDPDPPRTQSRRPANVLRRVADRLLRPSQSSHHLPIPASARPSLDESTRGRKKIAVNGWSDHYSPPGCACGRHGRRLDPRLHTFRPPGRYLRHGTGEPGHRRLRGRTWPDLRFPRGSPSELIQHALPVFRPSHPSTCTARRMKSSVSRRQQRRPMNAAFLKNRSLDERGWVV